MPGWKECQERKKTTAKCVAHAVRREIDTNPINGQEAVLGSKRSLSEQRWPQESFKNGHRGVECPIHHRKFLKLGFDWCCPAYEGMKKLAQMKLIAVTSIAKCQKEVIGNVPKTAYDSFMRNENENCFTE